MIKQKGASAVEHPFVVNMLGMRRQVILCLACAFLASCGNKEIKNAAYDYNYAVANYKFDEAVQYCTEETNNTTLEMVRYFMQFVDSSYIKSDTPAEIDIVSVKQLSDTTAYAVYHKHTPIKDFSDTMEMRKREGRWLAHDPIVKKDSIAQ